MNMDYIDVKGLQLVRRDNTPHVREVSKELLDVILESNDTYRTQSFGEAASCRTSRR
jgi:DNA polymerase elongation subunit (family B)